MIRLDSLEEINSYYQGKIDGVTLYAWWKDGIQYVGTTGKTLKEAKVELITMRNERIQAFNKGVEIYVGFPD